MIAVINYGMGNLRSVCNALGVVGGEPFVARHPGDLDKAEKIILPGVGAFGDGMTNLRSDGWIDSLQYHVVDKGKMFLGICLGMQLLATVGLEHGENAGLNFVSGKTVKMSRSDDATVRIPHIGWNDVEPVRPSRLFGGLEGPQTCYFVHSYVLDPSDETVVTGICDHGSNFVASVEYNNLFGVQFHPEKSQKAGLRILKNFVDV